VKLVPLLPFTYPDALNNRRSKSR